MEKSVRGRDSDPVAKRRENVTSEFQCGKNNCIPNSEVVSEKMRKHDLYSDKKIRILSNVDRGWGTLLAMVG